MANLLSAHAQRQKKSETQYYNARKSEWVIRSKLLDIGCKPASLTGKQKDKGNQGQKAGIGAGAGFHLDLSSLVSLSSELVGVNYRLW